MSDKYFLIEYVNGLHKIVKQSLQQAQRVKFTSFDVSRSYIIFGATSGGIYIFNRHPCEFIKLVPSKEGSVTQVAISSDEKTVAIATSRGLVILIENCFNDTKVQYQLYAEHRGYNVTAIKWHYNDLYCGDNGGKLSVITTTSLLSKAIFQSPCATLMHLDSAIVQLDTYSKFLLVSTRKKTFLCDTEDEQYRQIGKKLRDGDHGACFYTENPVQRTETRTKEKSIFRILKEGEKFAYPEVENVKIFCSRPGMRLWEANFEANVVCTYQFKDAMLVANNDILELEQSENCKLNVTKCNTIKDANLGRIIVISNKFLLTFTNSNLFIFNANTANLINTYNLMENIKDVKVIDNYIYIWDKKQFKLLAMVDLEMLIIRALANKQYYLCAEISLKYSNDLLSLLEVSPKIGSLAILKEKLTNEDILNEIGPLLSRIKDIKNISVNGIVKVENGHFDEAACSHEFKNLNLNDKKINSNCNEEEPTSDPNYVLNILYRQYQVNKMYSAIEIPQIYNLLSAKSLDEIVVIFKKFIEHVKNICVEDNNVENWCCTQYLKYVKRNFFIRDLDIDSVALEYIFESFKSINSNNVYLSCDCTFPFPTVKNYKPEFYELGCDLCKRLSDSDLKKFRHSVPYMWRHSIQEQPDLPLIIQFSDEELLNALSEKWSCDMWEDGTRLLIKIKRKICLNCEKQVDFDVKDTINWRTFGAAAVKSLGAVVAVKLLKRYAKFIPNEDLGLEFYQMCIFSAVTNEREQAGKFMEDICNDTYLFNKFDSCLKNYLHNRHKGLMTTKEFTKSNLQCSSCDLSVKIPILEDGMALVCGHVFHKLCLESLNNVCCKCDVKPN